MTPESLDDDSTDENFHVVSPLFFLGFLVNCESSFSSSRSSISTMVYDWNSLALSLAILLALLDFDLRVASLSAPSAAGSFSILSAGNGKATNTRIWIELRWTLWRNKSKRQHIAPNRIYVVLPFTSDFFTEVLGAKMSCAFHFATMINCHV